MDWVERISRMRRWARQGERAPHKPLLLLYALGRYQRDRTVGLRFTDTEADLARLLAEYGPPRTTSPGYPFHHLTSDGFWHVSTEDGGASPGPGLGRLRATGATGSLSPELRADLDADPGLLARMARLLLDTNFAPSLHADIRADTGLDIEGAEPDNGHAPRVLIPAPRRRDPALRELVLTAYEYRCAFCGYDGLLSRVPVGLEAAHVRWWAFEGPDTLSNALCLCSLHHKLFDKGVLGLTADRDITVSRSFVGRSDAARQFVTDLVGRPLLAPQPGSPDVAPDHIAWHSTQVFRGTARTPA
ncbi:phosphorothioated DNA-binding restriction endonuclease [Streptomyces sp. NPDC058220]|uniref:phosphorothioated DNA-binding restriction endonuclease n=1 Tax=unclassified Streptomyces TaxID=2593676 RepID=UPI00365B5A61